MAMTSFQSFGRNPKARNSKRCCGWEHVWFGILGKYNPRAREPGYPRSTCPGSMSFAHIFKTAYSPSASDLGNN